MKKIILISLWITLAFSCTTEITQEEGKKIMSKACFEEASKMSDAKDKIQKYCDCYADEVIYNSGFSIKELEDMTQSEMDDVVDEASSKCIDIALD